MHCQILLKGDSEFFKRRIQETEVITVSIALGKGSI